MLKVVSSVREPRYVARKEKQSPKVAGFPWNKPVVCLNWSNRTSATAALSQEDLPTSQRWEQGYVET